MYNKYKNRPFVEMSSKLCIIYTLCKTYFNDAPCVSGNNKQNISTAISNIIIAVY